VGGNSIGTGSGVGLIMAYCVQVEEIGVEGECDSIVVKKITVRQPDHSGQQQWEGSRYIVACFLSSPEEAFQTIPVPCICKAPPGRGSLKQFGEVC